MDPSTGTVPPGAEPPSHKTTRGTLREAFESLSMTAQFRLTAFAVVTATVLAIQLIGALWDTWSARSEAIDLARAKTTSMAARLQAAGGGALDRLDARPQFLAATFSLGSGEVLQRYVRGADDGSVAPGPHAALEWSTRPKGIAHAVKAFFALEPIFVGSPVELGGGLTGTVSILVDHRWIWHHAWRRLVQTPLLLLLAGLFAAVAANSLRRRVVEPLQQLAHTTRPRHWSESDAPPDTHAREGNELIEIAGNFEALTNRLAEFERDIVTVRHAASQQVVERTAELEARMRKAEALTPPRTSFWRT